MAARLAFRLPEGKWLEIRRMTHETVEVKICSDRVHEPNEFFCRIPEEKFVNLIMDAIGASWKQEGI
ncbi:hypothetical protein [Priestia abyssalis]|uniref:hypothetical protein n=1 Tax=Priestia abyssalis TaxID=1221450 RepID=UPI000994B117|nr:hypothetical protein [Priestia abyssalis]